jgi:hypothetical protein
MAQTTILSSIQRSQTFPITASVQAPNNCGTLSLILDQGWTEQMIHELPTINVAVFVDTDIKLLSIDVDMTTFCSDRIDIEPVEPYSIPLFDLPEYFDFSVTPIFDEDALMSHNLQIDSGDIDVFNTSDNGIVDTNISSYINEYWTTKTDTFNLNMVFDNSNIASGGSGGGGGGGQITVDTQVIQGSTNPVQNGAIYDFVNSSVSTNTAYFIGTFNSLSDLENYSGEVSNNDYAFVVSVDSNSNTVYNRYKYNSENETWNFEYSLNNSSFTAAEWETIQSGLTANDRTNYNNHLTNTNNPHSVTKAQVGLGNVDNTSDANKPVSTAMQTALDAKQNTLTFDGTYDASTNKVATVSTVTNAINDLDVSSVGGSGKYISAISETNGKIAPTVETMDTVPTNGSTKAVTSGGVQAPLAEVIDNGAKNKFDPASAWDSKTAYGVTITRNGDVYSIASGTTQSGNNNFINMNYQPNTNTIPAGDWVLSFDTPQQNVRLQVCWNGALQANASFGNNLFFTVPENTTDSWFRIILKGSTDMTGTSFKIMLCPRILWDVSHTYEPYALSNPVITPALIEQVDAGAKNLFDYDVLGTNTTNIGTSVVSNGVRFTMNSDKSVTVNRESSSSQSANVWFRNSDSSAVYVTDFCDDVHVFSGAAGASVSTYTLFINNINGSGTYKYFGEGEIIGVPQVTPNAAGISISADYSPSNLVIKPMICTKAAWDVSHAYSPYALSNPVLTQEVNWNVNQGVKNLIKLNPNTYTSGNVVVKLNDDGTISVSLSSGSTANTTFSRAIKEITNLRDMDLILNGCPAGGNYTSGYALYISDDGTTKEKDVGNGVLVTKNTTVTTSYVALIVRSGTAISGILTFKPMIRPAVITDPTFQPYALPNPVITPALIEQVNGGAKNIANWRADTSTISGVTFTINDDKTVSTSGTATARSQKSLDFTVPTTLKAGRYVLSGCPSGGEQSGTTLYCLYLWDKTVSARVASGDDTGSGIEFDWIPDASHRYSISVDVHSGTNASGLIFKPMICTKAAWDVSHQFEPYALPNPVITPALIEQVDSGAKNKAKVTSGTATAQWIDFACSMPSGDVVLSIVNLTSNDTDATECQLGFFNSSYQNVVKDGVYPKVKRGNNIVWSGTVIDTISVVRVYSSDTTAHGSGDTVTVTDLMICTASDWAVSQKFVPYYPTNRELYEKNNVIDISSAVTAETGYTVESTTHLYLQNNIVFGSIAIAKDSGEYSSSLTTVAKLPEKYAPLRQFINICGFSTDQWSITNIGYGFIQSQNASSTAQRGQISIKSPTANMNHLILQVNYPIQLDGTL